MDKFEYTVEGCKQAEKYLKDTNQFHLLENELSTDGYSLVHLANILYGRSIRLATEPVLKTVEP